MNDSPDDAPQESTLTEDFATLRDRMDRLVALLERSADDERARLATAWRLGRNAWKEYLARDHRAPEPQNPFEE